MQRRRWKYMTIAALSACVLGVNLLQPVSGAILPGMVSTSPADRHDVTELVKNPEGITVGLAKNARSAMIMDASTGTVLFEKNADKAFPMASITKIMTMLLVMEALHEGRLKWSDPVKVSEHAASMGGSQIFLAPDETMTVHDMVKGIAMASANDACVALAEHLDGSEGAFVERMNSKAKALGMTHTHFVNCNGLPASNHYSSARDIATMSRALLEYPEITKFTSVYSDYLRKDSQRPLWLVNTNKLVRFYDGVDGLKTGYTSEAKYCLSATAKKNGFRVIAVVMGEPKTKIRNAEVTSMLNWSFSNYSSKLLYDKNQVVATAKVKKGVVGEVGAVTREPVGFVVKRGSKLNYHAKVKVNQLVAPIKKGSIIGTLEVFSGSQKIGEVPLIADTSVDKLTFLQGLGRTFKKVVTFGQG